MDKPRTWTERYKERERVNDSAAAQEQLAKSAGQIGLVQPVNRMDVRGETGITPASAAARTNGDYSQ